MIDLRVDQGFSKALRAELVSRVNKAASSQPRKATRWWLGAGVFVGAALLGGVGATAAGLLTLPGAPIITPLGTPTTETHTGPATIDLGTAPKEAKAIRLEMTCLTTGSWAYESGATSTCKQHDLDGRAATTRFQIPVAPGKETTTINTQAQSQWRLTWTFVDVESTDWATNANGETYGAENDNGQPELVAVKATNGEYGYVRKAELDDATGASRAQTFRTPEEALAWQVERQGKSYAIPVYDSDGKTVVGEFVVQDGNGHVVETDGNGHVLEPELPSASTIPRLAGFEGPN